MLATSDPTLRAVFAEDVAALIGLVLAAAGLGARQLSGSAVPDAVGSILIGLLLAVVAVQLINRNRRFLVGEEADPRLRVAVLQALLDMPEVARVTYLRLEVVGPRMIASPGPSTSPVTTSSHTSPSGCVRWRTRSAPRPRWPAPCSACPPRTSRRCSRETYEVPTSVVIG